MTYAGTFKKGVIVLDERADLKDGQRVRVTTADPNGATPALRSGRAILRHAGTWRGTSSEMQSLLARLRSAKQAEVEAERTRLGLPRATSTSPPKPPQKKSRSRRQGARK